MKNVIFTFLLVELFLIIAFVLAPDFVMAKTPNYCPPGIPPDTVCLRNPLQFDNPDTNIDSPEELVVAAFKGFAGVIAAVAIAFAVFSGFKLIIASTEEAIETAKKSITWAVGGFIVSLLSFTLISGVAKLLGFEPSKVPLKENILTSPLVLTPGLDKGSFIDVMNFVMQNFLGLLGFASTAMIIYYGYRYLTSAGNEETIEKAKAGLRWAILGLAITLLSYTIIAVVQRYLVYGL